MVGRASGSAPSHVKYPLLANIINFLAGGNDLLYRHGVNPLYQ